MLRYLAPLALASTALAQDYYSAVLDGAQEVPPVATTARGWSVVRFEPATSTVRIFVFHEGLTGAPTAAHLHQGVVGVNGGVLVPLVAAAPNAFTAVAVLPAAQAAALAANGTYLNVHTAAFPGGEIRGQVVPPISTRFTGVLSGAQEVPANASVGTGSAIAFLHEPDDRVVYVVNTSGLANVTAAHFHQAATGVNGPVMVPLNGGNGSYCGVSGRLTAAQVAAWKANGVYVNVHTAAFPGGEIRAQMIKDLGDHFVAPISGAQQVPPSPSPGLGDGNLVVAPNGTITVTGAFGGLTGPAVAAHVHLGPIGVNGGIVFGLGIVGSTFSGTYVPTPADLVNLRTGNWYINVHTAAFPGGEIRGQLTPAQLPTPFGGPCLGSNNQRPQAGTTGFPSLGSAVSLDLYGALPGGIALLAFGNNRDFLGAAIPLPAHLPALGLNAPNCFLLVDPATLVVAFANPFGCANLTLNVPFTPGLRGQRFFTQWFSLDAAANPAGFVASNAMTLPIQ